MRSIFFRWFVLASIALVVAARLHIAVTRAFDPDEFAYLHWTWLIAHGYLPYRDFFFYIIPGFPWILSPILWLIGDSPNFLTAGRLFMLFIYGSCAGVVYWMTRAITQSRYDNAHTPDVWAPLLATLIFLTFPVTMDKTIDIRPDMMMLLLYFASAWIIFQLQKVKPFEAVASGMLFGASVLIFPKIIFGLPALLYLLISFTHKRFNLVGSNDNSISTGLALRSSGLTTKGVDVKTLLPWVIGASIVGLGLLGYLAFNNLIPQAIMSMTKYSLAVTSGKGSFSPILLLSPYPLIYLSAGGISLPWAVNTGVWMLGIMGLFVLFKINRPWAIFWSLFIAGNIFFVILFPVPYVQYLLPLSVAASVLAGMAVSVIPDLIRNPAFFTNKDGSRLGGRDDTLQGNNYSLFIMLVTLLLPSFFLQYRERVAPGADNHEQLQVIRDVLQVTNPNESVYDMVGSYVFRPDGYYICCHPYAEFVQRLASRPGLERELRESLIAHQTKFLVMDRVGFVFWKSLDADKAFLLTNYLPMGDPAAPATPLSKLYSLGLTFRCQQGACVQYDMDGKPAATRSTNTLTIIAPEKYSISIEPNTSTISIDGKEIHHTQSLDLGTGTHRFTVSPNTLSFRLQLTR